MSHSTRSRLRAQTASLPPSSSDGTRRRILETALQLFASRGYHDTSIRDLAKALELQPSALYAHFPSKEHVLAELVRIGHEAHHQALVAALKEAGTTDPAEQVRALVRAHTRMHALHPQLALVVNEEFYALTPEMAAPALALRQQSTLLLAEVVERGISQQRFSPPHPRATAAAISAMGVRLPYWYELDSGLGVDDLADIHAELALRMLGVRGRG